MNSMQPIETGNIILILVGAGLVLSGPYIIYRTVYGVLERRKADPSASLHLVSNGINFLIAVLFFMAGILFIVNNLRGNPLA
jgi:hypothetical protein